MRITGVEAFSTAGTGSHFPKQVSQQEKLISSRHFRISLFKDGGRNEREMTNPMTTKSISDKVESFVVKTLFGGLDDNENDQISDQIQDSTKLLANVTDLEASDNLESILQAQASLERFLMDWAFLLEDDKTLSTPITSTNKPLLRQIEETNDGIDASMILQAGYLRIMFRPPPRKLSFSEQKDLEKGQLPDRKGAKMDSKSPGGIQIRMIVIQNDYNFELRLVARRCGIDNDTIIKVASERTIMRRLDEALRIWRKVRAMWASRLNAFKTILS